MDRVKRFLKRNLVYILGFLGSFIVLGDAFCIGIGSPLLHPAVRITIYAMFVFYIYTVWWLDAKKQSERAKKIKEQQRKARIIEREKEFEEAYDNYRRNRERSKEIAAEWTE